MTRPVHVAASRALAQNGVARALPEARAALDRLGEQLATGRRVVRASDDPAAFAQARGLAAVEDRLAQHGRAVGAAQAWTDESATALAAVTELFARAREIGLRGANGVLDREDFARQVESLRDEAISRLTARSADGEYLFAGNETATRPLNADGSLAAGDFSGARTRAVAPGLTLAVNVPGTDALVGPGGVPLPAVFQGLADALRAGDADGIAAALDAADAAQQHTVGLEGRLGDVRRRLDATAAALEAQGIAAASRRSDLEDADLASVVGEMQRRQTALEAALRAVAGVRQTSLLDVLR